MISFKQQYKIAIKVFEIFKTGTLIENAFITNKEIDRGLWVLNKEKYQSQILQNYKFICIYAAFKYNPKNRIDMLNILNNLTNDEIKNALKIKNDILQKDWIYNEDIKIIKQEKKSPYLLYKEDKISFITIYHYYKKYPEKIKGRIMKREIDKINILGMLIKI